MGGSKDGEPAIGVAAWIESMGARFMREAHPFGVGWGNTLPEAVCHTPP